MSDPTESFERASNGESETPVCPDDDAVLAFLEGRLSAPSMQRLEAHLDRCDACRRLVAANTRGRARFDLPTEGEQVRDTCELAVGAEVGRYVILRRVGAGAMGVVYVAEDTTLHRQVALKLLRPRKGLRGIAELLREAQLVAQLSHPNVVSVFDAGISGERVYIAMEYLAGRTAREWLRLERPSWREVVNVFHRAALGVAAAHRKGLLHCDFKPENVVLTSDGRVVVTDFGLARFRPVTSVEARSPGEEDAGSFGTPMYMAPEQWTTGRVDARSDQFSVCVALYEALAGNRPFSGGTLEQIQKAVLEENPAPFPRRARVPRWLRHAVVKGLSKLPGERHASVELAALLEERSQRQSIPAARTALLAAGVAALMVTVSWVVVPQYQLSARCQGAAALIRESWSEGRRDGLQARFAQLTVPYAKTTAATAATLLDGHVKRLTAESAELCALAPVVGLQVDSRRERVACFEQRAVRLAATLDILDQPDAAVAENAVSAVMALEGACPLVSGTTPRDRSSQARQTALLKARVEVDLGRHDRARDELSQLEWTQGLSPHDDVRRRELQAAIHRAKGQPQLAEQELVAAFEASRNLGRADVTASLATQLVGLLAPKPLRAADGKKWAREAAAWMPGAGSERAQALLHFYSGLLHSAAKEHEAAQGSLQKALDLRQALLGPDHLGLASALAALGVTTSDLRQFERAVSLTSRAAELRRRYLGDEHPETLKTLSNVASQLMDAQKFAEAQGLLERVLQARERLQGVRHAGLLYTLNNLGVLQLVRGEPQKALSTFERAHSIALEHYGPSSPQRAMCLPYLGAAQERLQRLDDALATFEQGLQLDATLHGPESSETLFIWTSLGRIKRAKRDLAGAMHADQMALKIGERVYGAGHVVVAPALLGSAETALAQGRAAVALSLLERAFALQQAQPDQFENRADVRFALARALVAAGQDERRARLLAEQAREEYAAVVPRGDSRLARIEGWISRRDR